MDTTLLKSGNLNFGLEAAPEPTLKSRVIRKTLHSLLPCDDLFHSGQASAGVSPSNSGSAGLVSGAGQAVASRRDTGSRLREIHMVNGIIGDRWLRTRCVCAPILLISLGPSTVLGQSPASSDASKPASTPPVPKPATSSGTEACAFPVPKPATVYRSRQILQWKIVYGGWKRRIGESKRRTRRSRGSTTVS